MSTPTRIADTREAQQMTVDDADALLMRLAVLAATIKKSAAETDKKIADLKAAHEERTGEQQTEYNELADQIAAYITAHPERFVKPRQRVTPAGKYGLRTVVDCRITDEDQVIRYADAAGLALYTISRKLDKKAITEAIGSVGKVPGARLVAGDVASFTVSSTILDQPLKK